MKVCMRPVFVFSTTVFGLGTIIAGFAFSSNENSIVTFGAGEKKALLQILCILSFKYVGGHLVERKDFEGVSIAHDRLNHRKISLGPAALHIPLHHRDAYRPRPVP